MEAVAAERQALEEENDYNKNQISEYQHEIKDLKDEMQIMKSMITQGNKGKRKSGVATPASYPPSHIPHAKGE